MRVGNRQLSKLLAALKFETKASVAAANALQLRRLEPFHHGEAEALFECAPGHRCRRDACLVCSRIFRKNLVRASLEADLHLHRWTRFNIIPEGLLVAPGDLHTVDLRALRQRLEKRIARSLFADAIWFVGIDVSFNVDNNVCVGWQLHIYGIVNLPHTPALDAELRRVLDADPATMRPSSITQVNPSGFPKVLTYATKRVFNRRSGYEEGRLKKDGSPRKNQSPPQGLKAAQAVEAALWLVEHPVGARLILRGVRRVGSGREMRLEVSARMTRGP